MTFEQTERDAAWATHDRMRDRAKLSQLIADHDKQVELLAYRVAIRAEMALNFAGIQERIAADARLNGG